MSIKDHEMYIFFDYEYPVEGSVISFIAGEDRIDGTLSEYSYDFFGMPCGFYLDGQLNLRYPISFLESDQLRVLSVPVEDEDEGYV